MFNIFINLKDARKVLMFNIVINLKDARKVLMFNIVINLKDARKADHILKRSKKTQIFF